MCNRVAAGKRLRNHLQSTVLHQSHGAATAPRPKRQDRVTRLRRCCVSRLLRNCERGTDSGGTNSIRQLILCSNCEQRHCEPSDKMPRRWPNSNSVLITHGPAVPPSRVNPKDQSPEKVLDRIRSQPNISPLSSNRLTDYNAICIHVPHVGQ